MSDSKLLAQVYERFGVAMPKWRKNPNGQCPSHVRVYSKAEKAEQAAIIDYVCKDSEYMKMFALYFSYCDILHARGYTSSKDLVSRPDVEVWHEKVRRNFTRCQVEAIYHDMCCDPKTVLGEGSADGYWIYLDREWLDVSHLKVGKAVINLEEVWAVIESTIGGWIDRGIERECHFKEHHSIQCDRCGENIPVYLRDGCRFDVYENLLHCPRCVKTCTHWRYVDSAAGKKARRG